MALSPQFIRANADVLRALIRIEPFHSPTVAEFAATLGRDLQNMRKTIKALRAEGMVHADEIYASGALCDLVAALPAPAEPELPPAPPPAPQGAIALEVPLDLIDRDEATNPRTVFDEAELEELAASIRQHGVLQPILIRQAAEPDSPRRRVVAGERRWRAAKMAGLLVIPAVYRTLTDHQAFDIAVIENLQRADLNYIEEANAFRRWLDGEMAEAAVNEAEAKRRLGERISRTTKLIEQRLLLLKLPKADQARVLLPDDDYNRLKLRDARYRVETIEQKAKDRKAKELPPAQLLVMAELVDKLKKEPADLQGGYFYGGKPTAIRVGAAVPGPLKRKIKVTEGWGADARHFASLEWGYTKADLVAQFPAFKGAKRGAALHDLRVKVHGQAEADACKAEGRYATAWLNGPFEEDPQLVKAARKAAAEAEERREEQERQRAAAAAQAAKGAEVLEQVVALEAEWAKDPNGRFEPIIRKMLKDIGLPAPWRFDKRCLRAADGTVIEEIQSWERVGPVTEAMHRLHAALINAACGIAPPKRGKAPKAAAGPEAAAADDDTPDLSDGERHHQSALGRQCLELQEEEETQDVA